MVEGLRRQRNRHVPGGKGWTGLGTHWQMCAELLVRPRWAARHRLSPLGREESQSWFVLSSCPLVVVNGDAAAADDGLVSLILWCCCCCCCCCRVEAAGGAAVGAPLKCIGRCTLWGVPWRLVGAGLGGGGGGGGGRREEESLSRRCHGHCLPWA